MSMRIVAVDFTHMIPFGRSSRGQRFATVEGWTIERTDTGVRLTKGAMVRDVVDIGHVFELEPDVPLPFAPSPSTAPPPPAPKSRARRRG